MTGTEQALKLDQLIFSAIKPRQWFKSILIQSFSQVKEKGQPLIQWLFISFSPRLSFINFPQRIIQSLGFNARLRKDDTSCARALSSWCFQMFPSVLQFSPDCSDSQRAKNANHKLCPWQCHLFQFLSNFKMLRLQPNRYIYLNPFNIVEFDQ